MQPSTTALSERVAARLRRLDQRLHIDRRGRSEWVWAIPALTFTTIVGLFVFLGMISGVWAAEYIPTGLVIALVISGLAVACMDPGSEVPRTDEGGDGPGPEPSPAPSAPDPTVWVRLLEDAQLDPVTRAELDNDAGLTEPVGAGRRGLGARR